MSLSVVKEVHALLEKGYKITSTHEPWYIINSEFINTIHNLAQSGKEASASEGELKVLNETLLDPAWKHSVNDSNEELPSGGMSDVTTTLLPPWRKRAVSADHPLKQEAQQHEAFELYPERVWRKVVELFNVDYDIAIPRNVVFQAAECWVETHPEKIRVVKPLDGGLGSQPLKLYAWLEASLTPAWVLEKYADPSHLAKLQTCVKFDLRATFEEANSMVCWASSAKPLSVLQREIMQAYSLNGTESDVMWLMSPRPLEGEISDSWRSLQYPSSSPQNLADEFCDMDDLSESGTENRTAMVADIVEGGAVDIFMWSAEIQPLQIKVEPTSRISEAGKQDAPEATSVPSIMGTGGLCGLVNLGNTCYMNSALQCLAHTLPLTRYYITGAYKTDLNQNNPLGMGGQLAVTYADFLMQLWHPNNPRHRIVPKKLKQTIAKFAPNFQGYMQQDSQELLASLLDGLHEDCNRVRQKPYIEAVESEEERNDELAATEAWNNHKLRNESMIVDLFQGQYRSRLECPDCKRVSKTFDPFMYCSLPVPQKKRVAIQVSLLIDNGSLATWPITFPIEVWYRDEAMQRLSPLTIRPYFDTSISDFMRNLIKVESNQIRLKVCLVLMEFFVKHNPDNPASGSEELKELYQFLFNNPRFMGTFSRVKDRLSRQSQKSRTSPNKLVRALSSDSSGSSDSAGHFASLTTELLQSILKELDDDNEVPQDLSLDCNTNGGKSMRDLSPATMPRVRAAGEPINLTGVDSLGVGAASIGLNHLRTGSPGLEECLFLRSFLGKAPKGDDSTRPVLITFSLPLTPDQGAQIGCPAMKTITLEFVLNASRISGTCSDAVTIVVDEVAKKLADVLDSKNADFDDLEISFLQSEESCMSLKAVLRDDGRYQVENGSDLSEVPFIQVVDRCKLALNEAQSHIGFQGGIHFTASSEFISLQSIKEARSQGSPPPLEFLNSRLWKTTSLAAISHFVFPLVKLCPAPLSTEHLMQAFPAPGTLGRYNRSRRIHTIRTLEEAELSLHDCFEEFVACEQLGQDNMWYCSRCKAHVRALKKMDLWKLPDVLVVHLKRFSQLGRGFGTKIDSLVTFPFKEDDYLDLKDFLLDGSPDVKNARYRLFAVDRHFGTLGGGHYTAYVKCKIEDQWKW